MGKGVQGLQGLLGSLEGYVEGRSCEKGCRRALGLVRERVGVREKERSGKREGGKK